MIEIQAMFPVMVTADLDQQRSFYTSVFGFDAAFFEPDFYVHLVSPSTGVQLGFLAPGHASQPKFLHALMNTDGHVITFEVANAAAAYDKAQQQDLMVEMPLKHETWGQIHFIVKDPAGIKIDIVEHLDSASQ